VAGSAGVQTAMQQTGGQPGFYPGPSAFVQKEVIDRAHDPSQPIDLYQPMAMVPGPKGSMVFSPPDMGLPENPRVNPGFSSATYFS